ncbi:hypothetical protein YQE_01321, partial [Dendroctonus ponderosae]
EFKLNSIADYKDTNSNVLKKYWVGQGSLVVRGGCDYSQSKDAPLEEEERLKLFALMRLQSYGFHENHCIEAFKYCNNSIEDALYLLYSKYLKIEDKSMVEHGLTQSELLDMRADEKSSLESIYETQFKEKVEDVWTVSMKVEYLFNLFHNKKPTRKPVPKKAKEKCKNFLKGGTCRFGSKCRFSHEVDVVENDDNAHLEQHCFELEFRFQKSSNYPYEPPMIFLKSNVCMPPLMSLHICKRLHQEAQYLALDGIPCVYGVTELLNNEDIIKEHLKTDVEFLHPKQKLFSSEIIVKSFKSRPTHYRKGATSKDNKRRLTIDEIAKEDERIIRDFSEKKLSSKYGEMLGARKKLPAWTLRNDILNFIQQSQVVVISGETGCGKSTQVPQFILDDWISNYNQKHLEIVCTQPRRISAIGVAERVANERLENAGSTVGYQIRLESKVSSRTRLTFCTTGILLRRLESEPTLPNVTHIIVDEVHERSDESDFLLLILKDLLPLRSDLKVILMSATLNAVLFSEYFGDIPVINIPGRTFPVEQYYLEDILEATGYILEDGSEYCRKMKNDSEYIDAVMAGNELTVIKPRDNIRDENLTVQQMMARYEETILMWIVNGSHDYPKSGTILVFLPGIGEITSLYDQLVVHEEFGRRRRKYIVLPLHSSLTSEEQAAIFSKPKNGERKIVISTNLAETSVTIDDCVFVIDSGKMKEKHFDSNRNMESLETVWVTQANGLQRKGRAGRVMPGVWSFIEPPIPENITSAIGRLQSVGAIDKADNLTPLGHHLASLPVDVRIGKLMLYGAMFGCVDAALTIAACLSHKNPFVSPFGKRDEAHKKKMTFSAHFSDHITVLIAYKVSIVTYSEI